MPVHHYTLPYAKFRGEEKLSWQPLQVPSKCTHTCGADESRAQRPLTPPRPSQSSSSLTNTAHTASSTPQKKKPKTNSPFWFNSCQLFLLSTDIRMSCPNGLRGRELLGFTSNLFLPTPVILKMITEKKFIHSWCVALIYSGMRSKSDGFCMCSSMRVCVCCRRSAITVGLCVSVMGELI